MRSQVERYDIFVIGVVVAAVAAADDAVVGVVIVALVVIVAFVVVVDIVIDDVVAVVDPLRNCKRAGPLCDIYMEIVIWSRDVRLLSNMVVHGSAKRRHKVRFRMS